MSRIINAYTVDPTTIVEGDVAFYVVKVMIVRPGIYRLYRCEFTPKRHCEEIPQGDRIFENVKQVCEVLFPSVAAEAEPDW